MAAAAARDGRAKSPDLDTEAGLLLLLPGNEGVPVRLPAALRPRAATAAAAVMRNGSIAVLRQPLLPPHSPRAG
jgi:hypothetical protein